MRVLLKTCYPLQEYKKDLSILHPVLPRELAIHRDSASREQLKKHAGAGRSAWHQENTHAVLNTFY